MGLLSITTPLKFAAVRNTAIGVGFERMFTPDPKEAFEQPANNFWYFDIDLGAITRIDTFYLGYHNARNGQTFRAQRMDGLGGNTQETFFSTTLDPLGYGNPGHTVYQLASPVDVRFVRIILTNQNQPAFYAGVLAIGLAFQATYGHEWGAGRFIEDTGSAERLFGGGWATDDGVATTGYKWTFGDLSADERERLFQLVRDRRTTRSLLVVEDPDRTAGLNERVHWGLFQRLEPYERLDPINTKWALQIGDWG